MSAFAEPLAQARENVDHAEALLTRDPFGEAERSLAATLLREALAALDLIEQRAAELESERDVAQREADIQMGAKLAAQMTLKAVCDALDLPMVSLGNGWTEATPKIVARIEIIVDEADRLAAERDALAEAQQFPVSTVMSWKRRAEGAEALMRYARLLLDPERQDEPDEDNALRAFEVLSGVPLSVPARIDETDLLVQERDELTLQNEALGNDIVAAEARVTELEATRPEARYAAAMRVVALIRLAHDRHLATGDYITLGIAAQDALSEFDRAVLSAREEGADTR